MKLKVIIFCLAFLSLSSCNRPKPFIINPEEQIIRELSQNRIIMLGDFAHGFPLPFHTLTTTISTWLTMIGKGETDQHHLTLFLEDDDQMTSFLRQYLKTGDLNPWLDFILPSTTLERLEFYSDLRKITIQIDSMNHVLPASKQIMFDVQGPEAMNVFNARLLDSSDRAATLYFVNERDSLSAKNVIAYLKSHPDQKALMFFGTGHLIKNIVTKPFTEGLSPEEGKGAFIAYYLKKEFGDNQVFTITQVLSEAPIAQYNFGNTDVMIPSPDVPWKNSLSNNDAFNPSNFDAFIVRTETILPGHPLSHIFSKRILRWSIKRMEFLDPYLQGVFALQYYHQAVQAIRFLTDTNCTSIDNWKSWYQSRRTFDFNNLNSMEFRKRLIDQLSPKHNTGYLQDLEDIGFNPQNGNPRNMSRGEWDTLFEKNWPQVVFLNSIGIYWIGDSLEQSKAKSYLVQASGQNFDDPGLYLKWWRKKYYNVDY